MADSLTHSAAFRVNKSTPQQLARAKAYRLKNKEKVKASCAAWRAANPNYGNSPEEKEAYRKYCKEWREKNKDRLREKSRIYAKNNREKIRELQKRHSLTETYVATRFRLHLRRKFNITVEQYNAMLELQGGVCKICGQKCTVKRRGMDKELRPLSVDHDHKTGLIRGLLCSKCNSAIGLFMDSVEIMERAITYLSGVNHGRH